MILVFNDLWYVLYLGPRVRFDSYKSEKTIFDNVDEIDSNDTVDNRPPKSSTECSRNSLIASSALKVVPGVQLVVVKMENEKYELSQESLNEIAAFGIFLNNFNKESNKAVSQTSLKQALI